MATERKTRNVIFIMLDTFQFNYLGCYGNDKVRTPNLDRFARNGFLFENAYSEGVPTVPVRRAMLTGRFTLPYGAWQPLAAEDTTLADILWGREIQTALVYDTPPMRLPKYGYSRGFDYVRFLNGQELDHTTFQNRPLDKGWKPIDFTSPSMVYNEKGEFIDKDGEQLLEEIDLFLRQYQDRRTDADMYVAKVCAEAEHYLQNVRDKERPFLLWVDSFDPHEPWDPPSTWLGEKCPYDPDYEGNPIVLAPWVPVKDRITERECEHIRALYMEKIEYVDKWVGRLLDSIRKQGLWDDTMIVITSDHGQPMGNGKHGHGIMRKCRPWPYEELVHVPLLIHVPGLEGGKRIPGFVQNVDVTVTMLDALGVLDGPRPDTGYGFPTYDWEEMQGINLMPLMRGETDKIRDFALAGFYGKSWSIITEEYSYIHWISDDAFTKRVRDCKVRMDEEMWTCTVGAKVVIPERDELYDRKNDPFQLHNLIDSRQGVAEELLRRLKLAIGELRTS